MIKFKDKDRIKTNIRQTLAAKVQAISGPNQAQLFGRVQFEIPEIDLIAWLKDQADPIKVYVAERDQTYALAAVGAVDILTDCETCDFSELLPEIRQRIAQSQQGIKYFGGIAFNLAQNLPAEWRAFGKYYFVVPRFEVFIQQAQTFFACNFWVNEAETSNQRRLRLLRQFDELTFSPGLFQPALPTIEQRRDLPEKSAWKQGIRRATHLIKTTGLNKVVLSRKTTLNLSTAPNPFDLLRRLTDIRTDSFDFCFQLAPQTAFLGSTPELLYRRQGQTLYSEAIAGTRPRGHTAAEDQQFFVDLAHSAKDKQEHLVVVDNVLDTLHRVCRRVEVLKRLDILKLSMVQHLYTQFRGTLRAEVTDEEILAGLHPTPSVLGQPKAQAFQDLARLEPYARGWYAGPLGWIGADEATFVVGIRSGLLNGNQISLFSGAGIVAESDPAKEWDEIENKLGQFLRVFSPESGKISQENIPFRNPYKQPPRQWELENSIV